MTMALNMDCLEAQYRKEIESWKWDAIIADAEISAEPGEDDDGQMIGRTFLGTVFGLYPSGKYYTPWASGNVAPCDACKGTARLRQSSKNRRKEKKWRKANERCKHGFAILRKRDMGETRMLRRGRMTWGNVQRFASKACPECAGRGSVEVACDEVFGEVLEAIAEENGGWIESGEGNACDVFFGMSVEATEAEETADA